MKLGFWRGWGKPFSLGVGHGVAGMRGILLPFSDSFARPDGALGNGWIGSTWAIVSGKAVNTPTLGAELLTNGNMETGDPPSSWSALNATLDGVADERTGGAGAQSLSVANSGTAFGNGLQTVTAAAGTWLQLSGWARRVTATAAVLQIMGSDFSGYTPSSINTTSTSWTSLLAIGRAILANPYARCNNGSNTAGHESRFDDYSMKALTASTLHLIRNCGQRNLNITGTYGALTTACPTGVLSNVASDLSAGLVAWIDGVNIKLDKWVGSTWTQLITAAQAPAASKLPQIKTTISGANLLVDLLYNGVAIGSQQTVSNAEIVNNTHAGLFSTYLGNTVATFLALAN